MSVQTLISHNAASAVASVSSSPVLKGVICWVWEDNLNYLMPKHILAQDDLTQSSLSTAFPLSSKIVCPLQ